MASRLTRRRRRRRLQVVVVLALICSFGVTALVPVSAEEKPVEGGLRKIGELPAAVALGWGHHKQKDVTECIGTTPHYGPRILVDQTLNVGLALGHPMPYRDTANAIAMYDLEQLKTVGEPLGLLDVSRAGCTPAQVWDRAALDDVNHRVFLPGTNPLAETLCPRATGDVDPGLSLRTGLITVSYSFDRDAPDDAMLTQSRTPVRCSDRLANAPLLTDTTIESMSYDGVTNKLYFVGSTGLDTQVRAAPYVPGDATGGLVGTRNDKGSSLFVGQIDMAEATAELEWVIDLRSAGCGRRAVPWVQRAGADVLAYCNDSRLVGDFDFTGQQGYAVRIPLDEHDRPKPVKVQGQEDLRVDPTTGVTLNARVHRAPTLGGTTLPVVDPKTGAMLMATADSQANGNAVWKFDPRAGKFVGVVTGGFAKQVRGGTAFGFDKKSGRGYLLTQDGILVANTRQKPLPPGRIYHVLPNEPDLNTGKRVEYFVAHGDIAVAPASATMPHARLFVPVTRAGSHLKDWQGLPCTDGDCPSYVVVEDQTEDPESQPGDKVDRLTSDIEEAEGKTTSNASGAANAAGARLLVAGGVTRTATQADPACTSALPEGTVGEDVRRAPEHSAYNGSCLGSRILATGDRDVSLAASAVDAGSSSGVTADAGGLVFAPTDSATDNDVKQVGACGQGPVMGVVPEENDNPPPTTILPPANTTPTSAVTTTTTAPPSSTTVTTQPADPYRDGCDQFHDELLGPFNESSPQQTPEFRDGTKGGDEKGFPLRTTHCGDFGDAPADDAQAGAVDDFPRNALSTSRVSCDASTNTGTATSTADGLALLNTPEGVVSVASLFSTIKTTRTEEGQVTTASASARGVRIGPILIGEVRSESTTRAHGRPGTTEAKISRVWCGIQGPVPVPGCIDPTDPANQDIIDALNDRLGKLRIENTAARTQATPLGYQGVADRDPDTAAADAAMNNDDSLTVPGMQIVFYNDGQEGRNRYIVQLANVRSESRYGISEIPDFAGDESEPPEIADDSPGPIDELVQTPEAEGIIDEPLPNEPVYEEYQLGDAESVSLSEPFSLPAPGRPFVERLLRVPAEIVKNALGLLVNKPGEFLLLIALWTLLAAPVYLAIRRRSFAQTLAP